MLHNINDDRKNPNLYLLITISCAFASCVTKSSKIIKASIFISFFIFIADFIKLISKIPRAVNSQSINNNIWSNLTLS